MTRRYLRRHRLEKRDPSGAASEAVEPIVYYLDRGTPEPIRSALLDGARWWNQAFEAAGYRDAFRVELMPEGADPLDVRYNVIQWVHRSTRGWSYGSSVTDPRTGEIIKGHVTLGSLRVRQDYLIAEGLLSPYLRGDEEVPELAELALARIRQLSAHEVGHTLGRIRSLDARRSVSDAHVRLLRDDIERFLERPGDPATVPAVRTPAAPPGSPIGAPALDWLGAHPEFCAWDRDLDRGSAPDSPVAAQSLRRRAIRCGRGTIASGNRAVADAIARRLERNRTP